MCLEFACFMLVL